MIVCLILPNNCLIVSTIYSNRAGCDMTETDGYPPWQLRWRMIDITKLLTDKIQKWAPVTGDYLTMVDGLLLLRQDEVFRHDNIYAEPRLLVGLQGRKYTVAEKSEYWVGPNQFLIMGGDMVSSSRVPGVCLGNPFLSLSLNLDVLLVKSLFEEAPYLSRAIPDDFESHTTVEADPGVMEALLRLVILLDKPAQIPYLAPLIIKEIHYRLLLGPLNGLIRNLRGKTASQSPPRSFSPALS